MLSKVFLIFREGNSEVFEIRFEIWLEIRLKIRLKIQVEIHLEIWLKIRLKIQRENLHKRRNGAFKVFEVPFCLALYRAFTIEYYTDSVESLSRLIGRIEICRFQQL